MPSHVSPTEGIRKPSQKRGQDTLDRILTAGAELLSERGYEGFTLTEVGRRAGVSNGGIYWRIENKDALLHAIHDRFQQQAIAHSDALRDQSHWEGRPLSEVVDGAVREIADVFSFDPPLMRALSLRAGGDPTILENAASSIHYGSRAFCSLLEPRLRAAGHADPLGTADVVFTAISGAMAARITWPEFHDGPDLSWDRFVDSLCQMAVAQVKAGLPQ